MPAVRSFFPCRYSQHQWKRTATHIHVAYGSEEENDVSGWKEEDRRGTAQALGEAESGIEELPEDQYMRSTMSAGAKMGHRAPLERRFAAE
jgi:hypothetical protein